MRRRVPVEAQHPGCTSPLKGSSEASEPFFSSLRAADALAFCKILPQPHRRSVTAFSLFVLLECLRKQMHFGDLQV